MILRTSIVLCIFLFWLVGSVNSPANYELPDGATVIGEAEAWQRTQDLAYVMALQPSCSTLFYALSGFNLATILERPWWTVSFPDQWQLDDNAAAQAVCLPPHIAFAPGFLETNGAVYGALSYLHEVLHLSTCWRVYGDGIDTDEWQQISESLEDICLSSIYFNLTDAMIEQPDKE